MTLDLRTLKAFLWLCLLLPLGQAQATPLDVPPILQAIRGSCGAPGESCCSFGPSCSAQGSSCQSDGTCSIPLAGENDICVLPKSQPTADAGLCDPALGLTCATDPGNAEGRCAKCGRTGEKCCKGYSYSCNPSLACDLSTEVCVPAPVQFAGGYCDFRRPCGDGLACSDPVSGKCEVCGRAGAACCPDQQCGGGLACTGGTCLAPAPTVLKQADCGAGVVAPSLAQCPVTRSDEIRVLTYNIQMWPEEFSIATFTDFVLDHWPQTDERAQAIGVEVGDGGFDIIALNEAWSPARRSIIAATIEQRASESGIQPHPFIRGGNGIFDVTFGPEQDYLSPYHGILVESASEVAGAALAGIAASLCPGLLAIPCAGIGYIVGSAAGETGAAFLLNGGELINSGLVIMSRFPIISVSHHVYAQEEGFDASASKGVVHAVVFRGNTPNDYLHVFATHLQSDADSVRVRDLQIAALVSFIKNETLFDDHPIIVMGDFNVNGVLSERMNSDSDYSRILAPALGSSAIDPPLRDVWPPNAGNQPELTAEGNSEKRLDYIFASDPSGLRTLEVDRHEFRTTSDIGKTHDQLGFPTLSDHLGVSARFRWTTPPAGMLLDDPTATTITVGLAVNRLRAITFDSCNGKMDFYGRVVLEGGAPLGRAQPYDKEIAEGNDVDPTAIVSSANYLAAETRIVRASIKIRDDDDFFCGGGDDDVDINPRVGETELQLLIDLENNSVHLTDADGVRMMPPIGVIGVPVRVLGTEIDDHETAEITFTVTASAH